MYKKVFAQQQGKNKYKIHLWDEGGYDQLLWTNKVYEECSPSEAKYKGLNPWNGLISLSSPGVPNGEKGRNVRGVISSLKPSFSPAIKRSLRSKVIN